jgi:hypothetical protein
VARSATAPGAGHGAGLGLLTVARDAARPLEFTLVRLPAPGAVLFTVRAVV